MGGEKEYNTLKFRVSNVRFVREGIDLPRKEIQRAVLAQHLNFPVLLLYKYK